MTCGPRFYLHNFPDYCIVRSEVLYRHFVVRPNAMLGKPCESFKSLISVQ